MQESRKATQSGKEEGDEDAGSSSQVTVLAPVVRQKKGTYGQLFTDLNAEGFTRVRVNGEIRRTDEEIELDRYKMHDIDVVMDRLDPSQDRSRLVEAIENALKKAEGLVIVLPAKGTERLYSATMACPVCGMAFEELQPRMFSFNSPFGACESCNGLGIRMEFDPDLIIPDRELCIADGAVALYRNAIDGWRGQHLAAVAKHFGFDVFTPMKDLSEVQYNALMYGSEERIQFNMSMKNGDAYWMHNGQWEGLIPQSIRLYGQTASEYRREELEKFMRVLPCPACSGRRLKEKVLAVKVGDKSIVDVTDQSVGESIDFFQNARAQALGKGAGDRPAGLKGDLLSPRIFGARGSCLPHLIPERRHALRRRGAAHPPGHSDRLQPDRRSLCAG